MAKVATSTIFNFFDNIVSNKIEYCVMCLRTQHERRLVAPEALTMFMKTLTNREQFQCVKVCYICESKALASMRFISHFQLALNVDQIFYKLGQYPDFKKRLRRDIHLSLNGITKTRTEELSRVLQYEKMIAKMRISTEITLTDVLMVYTDTKNNMRDNFENTVELKSTPIETVVIDDNDDEPETPPVPYPTHLIINNNAPPFPIQQINQSLQNSNILYNGLNQEPSAMIVPNVTPTQEKTVLPDDSTLLSHRSTLSTNHGTLSTNRGTLSTNRGTLSANSSTLSTNRGTLSTNRGTLSTNSITLSTDSGALSSDYYKTLPRIAPMTPEIVRLLSTSKKQSDVEPKRFFVPVKPVMAPVLGRNVKKMDKPLKKGLYTNFDLMQPVVLLSRLPDCVLPKETPRSEIDEELDKLLLQKSEELKRASDERDSLSKKSCNRKGDENSYLVNKNRKIDWEDKIPMDVISFVESNNSRSSIVNQNQMRISDVRSERNSDSDRREIEEA